MSLPFVIWTAARSMSECRREDDCARSVGVAEVDGWRENTGWELLDIPFPFILGIEGRICQTRGPRRTNRLRIQRFDAQRATCPEGFDGSARTGVIIGFQMSISSAGAVFQTLLFGTPHQCLSLMARKIVPPAPGEEVDRAGLLYAAVDLAGRKHWKNPHNPVATPTIQ